MRLHAQRVLELVNHPGTDRALLDGQVGLDRRAAEGIVAHREGLDGVSPSADDEARGMLLRRPCAPLCR